MKSPRNSSLTYPSEPVARRGKMKRYRVSEDGTDNPNLVSVEDSEGKYYLADEVDYEFKLLTLENKRLRKSWHEDCVDLEKEIEQLNKALKDIMNSGDSIERYLIAKKALGQTDRE